jgi:hypothetical protein
MKKLFFLTSIVFVLMFSMHINSEDAKNRVFAFNYAGSMMNDSTIVDSVEVFNSTNIAPFKLFDTCNFNSIDILNFDSKQIKKEKSESIFYADLIDDSKKFIGTPYKWGATGPKRFDCSGFIQYIWKSNGIALPRTSYYQYKHTKKNSISKEECKTGDLVFFKGGRRNGHLPVGHVGMIVSNNDGNIMFIHAASGGVKISNLNESYYKRKFVGITRVLI